MPPLSGEGGNATSWGEYRHLVLHELKRIGSDIEGLADKIEKFRADDLAQIKTDIALLKMQAAMWGAVAGAAGTLIVSLITKFVMKA